MDTKKITYKKPKLIEHGKIKHLTMGSGTEESESNRFQF